MTTTTATKNNNPVEEVAIKPSLAQSEVIVKPEADIEGFITLRQKFITEVNKICVEGKDYHIIQGKKSLAKGGAEKIANIFQWRASFVKDSESLDMFGNPTGLVAFKCTLTKGEEFIGEGRGAASLDKNAKDPNKTLKMAQKSAYIDAVLRASGLSDFFTQDLEDHPEHLQQPAPTNGKMKMSEKQMTFIGDLCKQKNVTKDELKNIVKDHNFTYASDLIDYLLGMPINQTQQEIPVVEEGETVDPSKIPF
jgi:hypothetical protein